MASLEQKIDAWTKTYGKKSKKKKRCKKRVTYRRDPELCKYRLRERLEPFEDKWEGFVKIVGKKLPESSHHRAEVYSVLNDLLDEALLVEMNRLALHGGAYRQDEFSEYEEDWWTQQETLEARYCVQIVNQLLCGYYWNYRQVMKSVLIGKQKGAGSLMPDEEEILPLWISIVRCEAFTGMENTSDRTAGAQLEALRKLMETGSGGGCLVDLHTPILGYTQSTLFRAIESLYTNWRELEVTPDLLHYISLLFLRYSILSVSMFMDQTVVDREDMTDVEALPPDYRNQLGDDDVALESTEMYRVNEKFFLEGEAILGSMERERTTYQMLVNLTGGAYRHQCEEEADTDVCKRLLDAYKAWAVGYMNGPRATAILDHFRQDLLGEMIRPGERERFRVRWPYRDPNDTNVVSRLRPKDIERYRKFLMSAAHETIIQGDQDFSGLHTGRNELSRSILRYFTEEALQTTRLDDFYIRRRVLANPEEVAEFGWEPCPAVIIQTLGCYMVWFPWKNAAVSVYNFPIALYVACDRYLRDYNDVIRSKWAKDGDSESLLEGWKEDRIQLLEQVFGDRF